MEDIEDCVYMFLLISNYTELVIRFEEAGFNSNTTAEITSGIEGF